MERGEGIFIDGIVCVVFRYFLFIGKPLALRKIEGFSSKGVSVAQEIFLLKESALLYHFLSLWNDRIYNL